MSYAARHPGVDDANWRAHDPYALAPRLRGVGLFISSGTTGLPGPFDDSGNVVGGVIEVPTGVTTIEFRGRLRDLGIPVTAHLYGPGTHPWPYWQREMTSAWPLMMSAIGDAVLGGDQASQLGRPPPYAGIADGLANGGGEPVNGEPADRQRFRPRPERGRLAPLSTPGRHGRWATARLRRAGPDRLEIEGRTLSVTAFDGKAPGSLFVLLTDATSGVTTHAGHRALRVEAPDAHGTVTLDFNRATTLPRAYTDFATCPLPPAENRLPVAVEAGEKIPHERD